MIRTCLFDMGNVVLHFSHQQMCAQMGALCGRTAEEIRTLLFEAGLQFDYERGRLSDEQFHRRFTEAVGASIPLQELKRAGSDIFQLNAPLVPVLDRLNSAGCRLVLLSNTCPSHFEFVGREFDVLDRFDAFVLSFEVGAAKPEPAIFETALQRIGCAPEECFYTDDVADYVETGRGYGFQAEVFTGVPALVEQLRRRGLEWTDAGSSRRRISPDRS